MANHVIVGAGASGLYTAYRLLKAGAVERGDTVKVYEWSERPGGRIYTYRFPDQDGLYAEVGGMRFAVDSHWPSLPSGNCEGHVLVQSMIQEMKLTDKVVQFAESNNRLYYLRGQHVYENDLSFATLKRLKYGFNQQFERVLQKISRGTNLTADAILGEIAAEFAPGISESNSDRSAWCNYYANGTVPVPMATRAFPAGTPMSQMGYWNLLYDQLGDEGFDYTADGTGYSSNVMNWNSADAMQANNDYGSSSPYMRLDGGYSILFETLANAIIALGGDILFGQRLVMLTESDDETQTRCVFEGPDRSATVVVADTLFLAMPRRSLEMVAEGCSSTYMLNQPRVKLWLESSLDQPAIKAVLLFEQSWWTSPKCSAPPNLVWPRGAPLPEPRVDQWVGGATITDLPLRMIYYFANNVPGGPGTQGGPYVLLASYDDMNYSNFWREMEKVGDYSRAPSLIRQPLSGPTKLNASSPFAQILIKQLAEVHGIEPSEIPTPIGLYFQDWGQDPFGGGYHGWASHYDICQAMDSIRAPYANILGNTTTKTYIIGSCYSFDQAWVEGAFCTAESVLQDFLGLAPFSHYATGYQLICKPRNR